MTDGWQVTPGPDDQGEAAFVEEVLRDDPDLLAEVQRRTRETLARAYDREWKASFTEPVPQVARVLLRVEYADGQICMFDAEQPHSLECTVELPELRMPLTGDPMVIPPGDAASVRIGFKANSDPRYPMVMRTGAIVNPAASGG
jgi:hypothetical protein